MRTARVVIAAVGLVFALAQSPVGGGSQSSSLPAALGNAEFWALSRDLSEPDGFFRSDSGSPDNLLSNEHAVSSVAALLAARVAPGGVYIGVGPEQNFTYIAATRPRLAFIIDIRRGNLLLHLLYKALFETTTTRAEFVGRLFGRTPARPVPPGATAAELMDAFLQGPSIGDTAFAANLDAVLTYLTKTRQLPLDADDRAGIDYVYRHFHQFGPAIHYTSSINGRRAASSYANLMASVDRLTRTERTYLASDANFAVVKALHQKNLIVPLVGNFAGPKAIRAVGTYLKGRGATVTTFYVSNVEMYLRRNAVWPVFCASVAALPLDAASLFIRPGAGTAADLQPMAAETAHCVRN